MTTETIYFAIYTVAVFVCGYFIGRIHEIFVDIRKIMASILKEEADANNKHFRRNHK